MTGSKENEVSTDTRSFQVPLAHRLPFSGMPCLRRKPSSASTILRPLNGWISGWNSLSGTFTISQSQSTSRSEAVDQPAQLDADGPAPLLLELFAELLRLWRMGNSHSIGKRSMKRQEAGISQKSLIPVLIGNQQALQPAAIGQTGKQCLVFSLEPARKRPNVAFWRARTAGRSSPLRSESVWSDSAWILLPFWH